MLGDQTQVKQFVRGVRIEGRIHGQFHSSWNHTCFPLHPDVCYFTILGMAKGISKVLLGAALVAQQFSAAFSPGCDPGDPGSSPTSGSLHAACFSLCLCLCLSLFLSVCLSLMNKQIKSFKKIHELHIL